MCTNTHIYIYSNFGSSRLQPFWFKRLWAQAIRGFGSSALWPKLFLAQAMLAQAVLVQAALSSSNSWFWLKRSLARVIFCSSNAGSSHFGSSGLKLKKFVVLAQTSFGPSYFWLKQCWLKPLRLKPSIGPYRPTKYAIYRPA